MARQHRCRPLVEAASRAGLPQRWLDSPPPFDEKIAQRPFDPGKVCMFDIGFWEITVIAVVALLVVGPEQLPDLLRTAGRWAGQAKRLMRDAKAELDLEVDRVEQIKQRTAEEARIAELHRAIEEGRTQLDETIQVPRGATPTGGSRQRSLNKGGDEGASTGSQDERTD